MRVELSSRALKEGPLGGIGDGGDRRVVGLRRVGIAAEPAQQVRPDRMEEVVVAQVEGVDKLQRRSGTVDVGHRDRPVERDDRGRREGNQLVVELDNLASVPCSRLSARRCVRR